MIGKRNLSSEFIDLIVERPIRFTIKDRHFSVYPASIGRMLLCSQILQSISIDTQFLSLNISFESLRIATKYPKEVSKLIAISTFTDPKDLFDIEKVETLTDYIYKELNAQELATIFIMIFADSGIDEIKKHLGLDIEEKERKRIAQSKCDSNHYVNYGGRSILGAIIAPICKEYGLSLHQALWETSYALMQVALADLPTSIYLTNDEQKSLHISNDGVIIDGDSDDAWNRIQSINWN